MKKLKISKQHWILMGIFLLVLAVRLYLAFNTSNFTYDSYFHLKQIEQITEKGIPLYNDPLSYGGRTLFFLPGFHYFMAFFNLFLPLDLAAKLIVNLLFALLVILTYLIAKKITKDEKAALFSGVITGFIPVLWQTNEVSPLALFLPLILLAIYSFINLQEKKFVYIYLITILLLSLTSTKTFLLIVGLIFYLLLSKIEKRKADKAELELILFSLFLFIWLQFLFFKDALLKEGPSFIWQNLPSTVFNQYFPPLSIIESLVLIGVVPFFIGIYIIYNSLFKEKNKNIFLILSLAISTVFLSWFNLVEFKIALVFFGLVLAILFSQFCKLLGQYFKQTKFVRFKNPTFILVFILIILTSIYPSFISGFGQETVSPDEMKAFLWLKENTPLDSTVLATLNEGQLINYLSKRKNMVDDQFSLISNIEERFSNLNSLFVTKYQTQAIDLLDQYGIDYIFFSPQAKKEYKIEKLAYLDNKCFEMVYSNTVQIYKSKCRLEATR